MAAALGSYAIAYRFYARFIARRVLGVDDRRATPAERLDNGVDYHPTDRRCSSATTSRRSRGRGRSSGRCSPPRWATCPGQMAREEIGPVGGVAALLAVFSIMIILLAVLALVVVNALADSPWGMFSIAMTIPIAFLMGFYLRVLRPGRVLETTAIGVTLLLLAIAGGGFVQEGDGALADLFTLDPETIALCLVGYGFLASVLPVWMLLAPRDYLSTFMKVGTIALLAIGILVTLPVPENEPITDFARNGNGPVFAGALLPFVFITIACGALPGFHSLSACPAA